MDFKRNKGLASAYKLNEFRLLSFKM